MEIEKLPRRGHGKEGETGSTHHEADENSKGIQVEVSGVGGAHSTHS